MGTMQIQDAFEPYYEPGADTALDGKARQPRAGKHSFAGRTSSQPSPSADMVARLARCRDALARSLAKRQAEN